MVDEIVFWLICAIAAAGVWWAFFGRRHHPPPRDFCIEQQLQGMPTERLIGARLYSEAGKA
jgi:membrane protein implicated in regulation of membrane protease activity